MPPFRKIFSSTNAITGWPQVRATARLGTHRLRLGFMPIGLNYGRIALERTRLSLVRPRKDRLLDRNLRVWSCRCSQSSAEGYRYARLSRRGPARSHWMPRPCAFERNSHQRCQKDEIRERGLLPSRLRLNQQAGRIIPTTRVRRSLGTCKSVLQTRKIDYLSVGGYSL